MQNTPQVPDGMPLAARLDRNIRLLIWMQGLRMLLIVAPVYGPFFLANGLPKGDLFLLQGVFAFSLVVWEVPTGYLADRWGRRRCLALGDVLYTVAMLLFVMGHGFWPFCLAQMFSALGHGLVSGADSALLYDSLKARGRLEDYQRLESQAVFRGRMGEAVGAMIAAGFLFLAMPRWAFVANAVRAIVLLGLSLKLVETPLEAAKAQHHLGRLMESWRLVFIDQPVVRWTIFVAAVATGASIAAAWLVQTLYLEHLPHVQGGLPLLLLATYLTGGLFTAWMSPRVPPHQSFNYILCILLFVALVQTGIGLVTSAWVLLATLLLQLTWTCVPLIRREIHDHTPSAHRATTMSWLSLLGRLVQTGMMPIVAMLVNHRGAHTAFLFTAGILAAVAVVGALTRPARVGIGSPHR